MRGSDKLWGVPSAVSSPNYSPNVRNWLDPENRIPVPVPTASSLPSSVMELDAYPF
ncbi:hypothetical protein H8959_002803 [Pygathrix nigripes]